MNTPGQNSNAVAELAIGLAIFGIREMFSGKPGGELRGRTLGLHGFGFVARNVFRIARCDGNESDCLYALQQTCSRRNRIKSDQFTGTVIRKKRYCFHSCSGTGRTY